MIEKLSPEAMLVAMVKIQNSLNTKSYNTEWIEKGKSGEFDYEMAAAAEIIEFCDSLPFSWWSKAKEDRRNCITELVDAWHFIMSQALIDKNGNAEDACEYVISWYESAQESMSAERMLNVPQVSVKRRAKNLMMELGLNAENNECKIVVMDNYISEFFCLCEAYSVSLELLFARYLGKATLNKFRQDNGYKTGQYRKIWTMWRKNMAEGEKLLAPAEDNYYLSLFIDDSVEKRKPVDTSEIYTWLSATYALTEPWPKEEGINTGVGTT